MFVVFVSNPKEAESHMVTLDDNPLLHEYACVFPNEILGMPPQRDIDFQIDLILGAKLIL